MHRAVGQLLLDRIDLAVKPIPELSAHLQGMPIRIDFLSIERIASAVNVLQILIVQRHHNALKRSFDRFSRFPLSALLLIIAAALGMHLVHTVQQASRNLRPFPFSHKSDTLHAVRNAVVQPPGIKQGLILGAGQLRCSRLWR